MPSINPALRRSYDLRGVVGKTLGSDDAHAVGLRFAAVAHERGLRRIAVSRDGRASSPVLEAALLDGLRQGGVAVVRLPLGPTPLISFAIDRLQLDGGVMVTGSHNPPDQNGFKFQLGGHPFHGADLQSLWRIEPACRDGGRIGEADISETYLETLARELEGLRPFASGWDSGNGATGAMVERLVARLPGRHETLYTEIDGDFPNHHPDPSVASNMADLAALVRRSGLEVGIGFDGDGDRIGLVDGEGEIVWPDQILLLLAADVLRENPQATIVADVKSSSVLFEGIAALGGRAVMSPSGYVLVRERMLAEAAPLAGEMSGHIFFGDRWHHADDALYVAIRSLRALARSGLSLSEFRRSLPPSFATEEIRVFCPDERKRDVLGTILAQADRDGATIDTTDGLRVTTREGWWLLRASGTEPKLTARCEAVTAEALSRMKRELADRLISEGIEPGRLA